jgi:histidinol dehydrogenase
MDKSVYLYSNGSDREAIESAINKRYTSYDDALQAQISAAYNACASNGAQAVVDYTRKFDASEFEMDDLYISSDEVDAMQAELSEKLKAAIAMADENISLTNAELMAHLQDWHKEIKPGIL